MTDASHYEMVWSRKWVLTRGHKLPMKNHMWRMIIFLHLYQTKLDCRLCLKREEASVKKPTGVWFCDRLTPWYEGSDMQRASRNTRDGILQSTLRLHCILVQIGRETEVKQDMLGCYILTWSKNNEINISAGLVFLSHDVSGKLIWGLISFLYFCYY